MSDDVLITPASRKVEFKDSSGNVDAVIQTDSSGNLSITNTGGDLSLGDTTSDIFIGDGTNNIDLVFEQNGEIRGTSGVTVTVGASGSTVNLAGTVQLGGTTITSTGAEINSAAQIKRTEFDVSPGTTSASINFSADSNVYKYVFVLTTLSTSSGPNDLTLSVGRAGTDATWTGGYAYTTGTDGYLPTVADLWAGMTPYSQLSFLYLEINRTTDKWFANITQTHTTSVCFCAGHCHKYCSRLP